MEIKPIKKSSSFAGKAMTGTEMALLGHRTVLQTKLAATNAAITAVHTMKKKNSNRAQIENKENKNMKNFFSALTVLAVAGATLGAAGYYLYKKNKELDEYEDLLYTDELDREFTPTDDTLEKAEEFVEDVKDIAVDAAETVKDAFTDVVSDVKSAIDNAIDE